jgi:hypothetical protein
MRDRLGRLVLLLLVACMLIVGSGAAAAKGQGKSNGAAKKLQTQLTWSPVRIDQTVNPGQSVSVTATVSSTVDVENLTLAATGGLAKMVTITPASLSLKAGIPATVTIVISAPATNAHTQGGSIKAKLGKRSLPGSLKVKITVPGSEDEDK